MDRIKRPKKAVTLLAAAVLLIFCSRPVSADTSRLELYIPEENESQQNPEHSGGNAGEQILGGSGNQTSAPQTSDSAAHLVPTFLASALGAAGLTMAKRRRRVR